MGSSSFIAQQGDKRRKQEKSLYLLSSVLLFACAAALLLISVAGALPLLIATWLLFACAAAVVARPVLFGRGIADVVMGIITAFYYLLLSWALGSVPLSTADSYRIILAAVLFFAGLSSLLVFARMTAAESIPMLLVLGVVEIAAALFLILDLPPGVTGLCWITGLTALVGGFSSLDEHRRL
jgi:uncharacterized membrane protein HdeD (DUF308 family)